MATEQIVKLLKLLGSNVPALQNRTGWVISTCPLAPWRHDSGKDNNPSFGIRRQSGDPHAHCFSCGFGGSASDLAFTIRHLNKTKPEIEVNWSKVFAVLEKLEDAFTLNLDGPDIEEMLFAPKKADHVFPDWWFESFLPATDVPIAMSYLAQRGVSGDVAHKLDLRVDTTEGRICFPVRDFQGKLRGLHGRAMHKDTEPRYRMYTQAGQNNPLIWLGEHWVDFTKPVVVVEGPFDLASVFRVYPNVVSPLFANPSNEKIQRMADALEQVTLLDRGKAGDLGRAKMQSVLGSDHLIHHVLPPEGRKDPGECSESEIRDILQGLVPLKT